MAISHGPSIQSSSLPETEHLPESDGKPMAETDVHRSQMIGLLECLGEYYRSDPNVYVTGNILLYYRDEEGERQSISPDVFVVRGIEKKVRRIYNLDVEKKAPEVLIELTSRHTKVEDLGNKRIIYADLGVREYFIFDPLDGSITPQLRGFRLEGGEYIPLVGTLLHSEVLGLDLVIEEELLRLYDPQTKERLRFHAEAEMERREAEAARREAETAEQKVKEENAQLREELERLRKTQR
jgi:Uma2 family endonuclease